MMRLGDIRHIYFLGIGGIGMSAIARYFATLGVKVSGYDKTPTALTRALIQEGISVVFDENPALLPENIDLVVYTPAVPASHAGFTTLRNTGLPVMKRSEVLGLISQDKRAVCIAGTHGKTTTSCMAVHVLMSAGLDISAFLGGISADYNTNYILGQSDVVVMEADEYDRSFLRLRPYIATISSMDADHLDIYGDHGGVIDGYSDFVSQICQGGVLVIRQGLRTKLTEKAQETLVREGIRVLEVGDPGADIVVSDVRADGHDFVFTYEGLDQKLDDIRVSMPGRHNVENAAVALTIGFLLGAAAAPMRDALWHFKGIQRRFERIYDDRGVTYIDDYAHHPEELRAAISAARSLYPGRHLTGIFQPHLYSRTKDFADGFAMALDGLDAVILLDIYPARELPVEGVTSELIFGRMKLADRVMIPKEGLMSELDGRRLDVLLTLGAGDIDTFVPVIKEMLSNRVSQ